MMQSVCTQQTYRKCDNEQFVGVVTTPLTCALLAAQTRHKTFIAAQQVFSYCIFVISAEVKMLNEEQSVGTILAQDVHTEGSKHKLYQGC